MYCPSCGADSTQGLNYCKKCGANLVLPTGSDTSVRMPRVGGLFWAVALLTVGGLGVLMGSIIALAAIGVRQEDVFIPIAVVGCFTVLGIAWLLVRQISRVIDSTRIPFIPEQRPIPAPPRRDPAQIAGPPLPVPSVTEHTTRTFDRLRHQQAADVEDRSWTNTDTQ